VEGQVRVHQRGHVAVGFAGAVDRKEWGHKLTESGNYK
jgi:hypothetical protein